MEPKGMYQSVKTTKKSRAVGAFRSFLNFLQKPAKKRNENSPDSEIYETSDSQSLASSANENLFKSKSDSGNGSVSKESTAGPKIQSSHVQENLKHECDSEIEDEVFFDESYFEDDYIEDFSSSGSSGGSSNETEPEETNKEDFDDETYLNNLNEGNQIDKEYIKEFPDFICQYRNLDINQNGRRRHKSMPSLVSHEFPGVSNEVNSNIFFESDEGRSNLVQMLQKPIPYFGFKSEDFLNLTKDEMAQDIFGKGNLDTSCLREKDTLDKMTTPSIDSAFACDSDSPKLSSENDLANYEKIKRAPSSDNSFSVISNSKPIFSESKPGNVYTADAAFILPPAPDINDRGENVFYKTVGFSNKDQEQNAHNQRSHKRGSFESGYGSGSRSSASIPLSPAKATPMSKLHQGAPLSPHTLNALDGVSKPTRFAPKRNVKLKFIFPAPVTVDLKSLPDNVEASLEQTCRVNHQTKTRKDKTNSGINYERPVVNEKCTSIQNLNIISQNLDKIKFPVAGFGVDLNISMKLVDLNNNLLKCTYENINSDTALSQPAKKASPLCKEKRRTPTYTPYGTPPRKLRHMPTCAPNDTSPHTPYRTPGRTPTWRHKMADLEDLSSLRPICTSSPLQDKLAQRNKKTPTPLHKSVLEFSAIAPLNKNNARTSPLLKIATPIKSKDKDEEIPKTTSERRKKLKRRSARARLNFDDRDINNNLKDNDDDDNQIQTPVSGDYVLLKKIAESITDQCGNREVIGSWVDLAALMENLNSEYLKLMEDFNITSDPRLSNLQAKVKSSKAVLSNLSVSNCLNVVLLSYLVNDGERIVASLDFVFENIPRVIQQHQFLSHLSPEMVVLFLNNPRCIVKNNHGFPLSYSSSEKEVFKAVVKYIEAVQRTSKRPLDNRIKCLLSTVADSRVLTENSTRFKIDSISYATTQDSSSSRLVSKKPPRTHHRLVFNKLSPSANKNREHFYQPFISSSVQSLDEIPRNKIHETASPIAVSAVCKENYILRKLYFSYKRHNSVPYITKIGLQYSCKGKKKTAFIAPTQLVRESSLCSPKLEEMVSRDLIDEMRGQGRTPNLNNDSLVTNVKQKPNEEPRSDVTANGTDTSEMSVVKKAAVVLKADEHITALSVLGQKVVHNVEIITNTGRRIRIHGIDNVEDAQWTAMPTPQGTSPFCLHGLYGDVHKAAGRSYIRDLGAIWVSASFDVAAMNDLT